MSSRIKKWFSDNLIVLLFFALIAFAILSIRYSSQNGDQNAQKMYQFYIDSAITISNTTGDISKIGLGKENKPEVYDQVIDALNKFDQKLNDFIASIPSQNKDTASVKFQNALSDFYLTISKDSIKNLIEKQKDTKTIIQDYTNYYTLNTLKQKGNKAELEKAYQSGVKILEFRKRDLARNEGTAEEKARIQKNNENEEKTLNSLNNLIKTLPDGDLSEQSRKSLIDIYEPVGWPIDRNLFTPISKDVILNQQYFDDLRTLDNLLLEVSKKYKIHEYKP